MKRVVSTTVQRELVDELESELSSKFEDNISVKMQKYQMDNHLLTSEDRTEALNRYEQARSKYLYELANAIECGAFEE